MPTKHALLSPSSAHRWINCPGSVALAAQCPQPQASEYAEEGTLAHSVGELKLRQLDLSQHEQEMARLKESPYWCGEMDEATSFYADAVMERLAASSKDAMLLIEQQFSLDTWASGSFGTADAVIIGGQTLEVIDLKYGKGVKVDAGGNPQLRLYGLGACVLFKDLYDIETVRMTIIQPRLDHISTEELSLKELWSWGENEVKPKAEMAADGTGYLAAGEWCRWCPAKARCRKRAEANLELARYEFQPGSALSPEEIADILGRADELQRWAADVQSYALGQALSGQAYPGWKVVEGRSVRKYADELAVAETLKAAGYDEALLYERKLNGITAMEKVVGKKQLTELLGDLLIRPAGKPVLVPESDKREKLNTAKNDFKEDL